MESITVKYKTRKTYCDCCEQKLPTPQISEAREFNLSKETMLECEDWGEIFEDKDEFSVIVDEYVHETIHFCAASMNEQIIVNESEVDKVKNFIIEEIVNKD